MARRRGKKRLPEKHWFPDRSNHPYTGQLRLQQQTLKPELEFNAIMLDNQLDEYASGSGYTAEDEEEETKEGLNSDHEMLVDSSCFRKRVEENGGDQESEAKGDREEDENFGVNENLEPENQDSYHSQENGIGYDNSMDDRDRYVRCQSQPAPGTSQDFIESEWEMGMMKDQENDYETGMDRLRVWLDKMGLGKYGPLFDLHEVDDEVLQCLTIKDIKDMGVTAVGSRWKIYWYIQKFCIKFS